jgi:hypothetical protein
MVRRSFRLAMSEGGSEATAPVLYPVRRAEPAANRLTIWPQAVASRGLEADIRPEGQRRKHRGLWFSRRGAARMDAGEG